MRLIVTFILLLYLASHTMVKYTKHSILEIINDGLPEAQHETDVPDVLRRSNHRYFSEVSEELFRSKRSSLSIYLKEMRGFVRKVSTEEYLKLYIELRNLKQYFGLKQIPDKQRCIIRSVSEKVCVNVI